MFNLKFDSSKKDFDIVTNADKKLNQTLFLPNRFQVQNKFPHYDVDAYKEIDKMSIKKGDKMIFDNRDMKVFAQKKPEKNQNLMHNDLSVYENKYF